MVQNLYTVQLVFSIGMVQGWYNTTMMVQDLYTVQLVFSTDMVQDLFTL